MPAFTMELFRAIELSPDGDIGLNEYPIFDETYRAGLNQKITNHYYMREIGLETLDYWRFAMKRRMNEIMPLYNQLYKSEKSAIDPFVTVDMTTLTTSENESNSSGESSNTTVTDNKANSRAVTSQTPQMMLSGRGDYATGATDSNSGSTGSADASESNSGMASEAGNSETNVKGYSGNPSELLAAFRANMLNIDMMIITNLEDLFMGVWDNGDDYLIPMYPFTPLPSL